MQTPQEKAHGHKGDSNPEPSCHPEAAFIRDLNNDPPQARLSHQEHFCLCSTSDQKRLVNPQHMQVEHSSRASTRGLTINRLANWRSPKTPLPLDKVL